MGKLCKLLAICCILFISGCTNKETSETAKSASQETITLHIVVNKEGEEIFNKKVSVKDHVTTLADFLEKANELKVEMEVSA